MASRLGLRVSVFFRKYPVVNGMITYAVVWPTSNLCQQYLQGREKYDFAAAARFCFFGTFCTAPTLYAWVKIAAFLVPGNTFKVAVTKTVVEQIIFSPFVITTFYAGMTLLENKSWEEAKKEVVAKYWPTYRMGICFWPFVQTINTAFVKERHRVPVLSVASFFWTIFLSYMKQSESAASDKLNIKNIP